MTAGRPVGLGARAFDVLLALVERRDRIVAKNELLDSVWPGLVVEENNLQVQISSLRKALGPQAIATIPGRGYRFTAALDFEAVSQPDASAPRATSAPEATDTHDQRVRFAEAVLRIDAELGEQDVPAVAQKLRVVHGVEPC